MFTKPTPSVVSPEGRIVRIPSLRAAFSPTEPPDQGTAPDRARSGSTLADMLSSIVANGPSHNPAATLINLVAATQRMGSPAIVSTYFTGWGPFTPARGGSGDAAVMAYLERVVAPVAGSYIGTAATARDVLVRRRDTHLPPVFLTCTLQPKADPAPAWTRAGSVDRAYTVSSFDPTDYGLTAAAITVIYVIIGISSVAKPVIHRVDAVAYLPQEAGSKIADLLSDQTITISTGDVFDRALQSAVPYGPQPAPAPEGESPAPTAPGDMEDGVAGTDASSDKDDSPPDRFILVGDSILYGMQLHLDPGVFATSEIIATSGARLSSRTAGALAITSARIIGMMRLTPDATLVLALGENNWGAPETYRTALRAVLASAANKRVIVIAPLSPVEPARAAIIKGVADVRAIAKEVVSANTPHLLLDMDDLLLKGCDGNEAVVARSRASDGVHLTQGGYERVATALSLAILENSNKE